MRTWLLIAAASLGAGALEQVTSEVAALLEQVMRQRDDVDPKVLDAIGRHASREALDALDACVEALFVPTTVSAACAAYVHFLGAELEAEAVAHLGRLLEGSRETRARAAATALAAFGGAARDPLERALHRHDDLEVRVIAAGGLAGYLRTRHDPDSLRALLSWYRPPRSGTRERGIAALASFDDPEHLQVFEEYLRSRHADPTGRTMALEALGRIGAGGADAARAMIARSLEARNSAEARTALEVLESLGHRGHDQKVESLLGSKDASLRHAAFLAVHRLRRAQPEWRARVLLAARGRDPALRAAAASALADLGGSEAPPLLHELLADPEPLVRRATIDALTVLRDKSSIPRLIERLAGESLRLREHLRASLSRLTGLDFGDRPPRWRAWWLAEGEGFELPPADRALAAELRRDWAREEGLTRAVFYGIPIASDRLAFVLDVSGSMSALVSTGGEMRIDVLRRELVQALEGLPAGSLFDLIFFSDHAKAWQKHLVELDEDSLAKAREFIERQGAGGGTALYDALLEALEEPEIDTIVLLSDGEPTEGRLVDPYEIIEDLRARNRLRRVVFHTVAVGGPSALLEELSTMSGGTHRVSR